jgi:hypothetical protein
MNYFFPIQLKLAGQLLVCDRRGLGLMLAEHVLPLTEKTFVDNGMPQVKPKPGMLL